ncbi:MAG: PEP-CTERM sorting domain-containing protein, partial [Bryobacterales bacterium]|nr:PEP-CTERM sorting domain-containing protein [Bryobacterales bacterium]
FTTPEPSSIALLVSGILVFSLLLRRKTKNTAAQLLK